jgi:acetyl-CoA carboxylase biotin carboxyl carrier protein
MAVVTAVMAGTILDVLVSIGEQVSPEQEVVSLESMKMQIFIQAPTAGTVKEIKVTPGTFVNEGEVLLVLE